MTRHTVFAVFEVYQLKIVKIKILKMNALQVGWGARGGVERGEKACKKGE